jgi:hypothetical protein
MQIAVRAVGILVACLALATGIEPVWADEPSSITDSATQPGIGRPWPAGTRISLTPNASLQVPEGFEFVDDECLCISEDERAKMRLAGIRAQGGPEGRSEQPRVFVFVKKDILINSYNTVFLHEIDQKFQKDLTAHLNANKPEGATSVRFDRWVENRGVDDRRGLAQYAYRIDTLYAGRIENQLVTIADLSIDDSVIHVEVNGYYQDDSELKRYRDRIVNNILRTGHTRTYYVSRKPPVSEIFTSQNGIIGILVVAGICGIAWLLTEFFGLWRVSP